MEWSRLRRSARTVGSRLSPRHRRWLAFLSSFELDPRELSGPLEPPGERAFLMAGSPRSGTTLLSAVLYQPPAIVTFMEPWDGMRYQPAELFRSLRQEIATGTLRSGKLDVPQLMQTGRVKWWAEGETPVDIDVASDCLVGVKWPAFWQYLDLLPSTKFLITFRHPFETISSYKKKGGALLDGLDYDIAFNRGINTELLAATGDESLRRILLYERINQELLRSVDRDNVVTVRYERWFEDPDGLLEEIGEFLGRALSMDHVAIRRPSAPWDLTVREVELIREHCSSAATLGYDLDVPVSLP